MAAIGLLTVVTYSVAFLISPYEHQTGSLFGSRTDSLPEVGQWIKFDDYQYTESLPGFWVDGNTISLTLSEVGHSEVVWKPELDISTFRQAIFAGEMKTEDVRDGKETWHSALLSLYFVGKDGKRLSNSGMTLGAKSGTTPYKKYYRIYEIPDSADGLEVSLKLNKCQGSVAARMLDLNLVTRWSGFKWVAFGLAMVWLMVFAPLLIKFVRSVGLAYSVFILFLISMTAVGILMPHLIISDLVNGIVNRFSPGGEISSSVVLKTGHWLSFAVLGFFLSLVRGRMNVSWPGIFYFVSMIAIASEGAQLYLPGRSPRVTDVAIDISGAIFGFLVYLIFRTVIRPVTAVDTQ